jgi:hypothetical protein
VLLGGVISALPNINEGFGVWEDRGQFQLSGLKTIAVLKLEVVIAT